MDKSSLILRDLKNIECPTDNVIERVTEVLETYNPQGDYQIAATEDEDFIHDNIRVYNIYSE
jgi:hypothetical protein